LPVATLVLVTGGGLTTEGIPPVLTTLGSATTVLVSAVPAVPAVPANGELVSPRSSSVCASSMLGVKTGAVGGTSVLVSSLAYTGLTSKAASLSAFFLLIVAFDRELVELLYRFRSDLVSLYRQEL
jgi:hypothetical protein